MFPILPLIGLGATALGSFFGNKNKNAQRSNSETTSTSTTTTAPTVLGPEYAGLQAAITPMIMKRLLNPTGVPAGYETGGIKGINRTYDLGKQSIANNLTARGLGTSPIAGAAETRLETGRLGAISDFQQEIPLIARDLQNQDIGLAMQNLNFGRSLAGSTTTHTGSGTSSGTVQGGTGGAGGFIGDLSSMLGFLIGSGAFSKAGGGGIRPNSPGFEYF